MTGCAAAYNTRFLKLLLLLLLYVVGAAYINIKIIILISMLFMIIYIL